MHSYFKSAVLVSLQFLLILVLFLTSPFKPVKLPAAILFALSAILLCWSVAAMLKSKLRVFPEPAAAAVLITNGPYHFIRHPMYTAVLAGATGLLFHYFTVVRLVLTVGLLIVLIVKLTREEIMLQQKFAGYKDYMKTTSKLVPLLF